MRTHLLWLIAGIIVWTATLALAAEDDAGTGNPDWEDSSWDALNRSVADPIYYDPEDMGRITSKPAEASSFPLYEESPLDGGDGESQPAPQPGGGGEADALDAKEAVVDELVASGLSETEAREIAAEATRDVAEGREHRESGHEAPHDLTPEAQALMTEVNQFAHDLQNQGLTDQQIRERVETQYGEQFREIAEQHQGERDGHSREQMEQMMREHPEMMERHREEMERHHEEYEKATPEQREQMMKEYEAPTHEYEKPAYEPTGMAH